MKKKIDKKDIICIIIARAGSKGLKNKNLRKLNNLPLISYPILYAKKSRNIGTILVSTDSIRIAKIAKKYGAEVPFLRPKKYSTDNATTESTLKHALLTYEKITKKKFKVCVFLTTTDIFRSIGLIKKCIDTLIKNPNLESVFAGSKTHKNYWEIKGNKFQRLKKWMKYYKSRQIKKNIFREDTGIICASRASLWRKGKRIGEKVKIIDNPSQFSYVDIHNSIDLKLAELIIKNFNIKIE